MTSTTAPLVGRPAGSFIQTLNGKYHAAALNVFMFVVIAHWAEHLVQAFQIWALDWKRPEAKGVLGHWFPWLVTSEWLHYGYALIMVVFLVLLRHGFSGRARTWWTLALGVQLFHHLEHFLLLLQAITHTNYFGGAVPTSMLQFFFPRVELHLFYNALVTIPMIVAVVFHVRDNRTERRDSGTVGATTT